MNEGPQDTPRQPHTSPPPLSISLLSDRLHISPPPILDEQMNRLLTPAALALAPSEGPPSDQPLPLDDGAYLCPRVIVTGLGGGWWPTRNL